MAENCVFCKIVKREIPCEKIWEDENFIAFLDVNPVIRGHTLVIPKLHFRDLISVDGKIAANYIGALQEVGKVLIEKYNCDGFNVVLNNGKSAEQIVDHVHFHLFPRNKDDGYSFSIKKL